MAYSGEYKHWVFCDNEGCLIEGKGKGMDLAGLLAIRRVLETNSDIAFSLCTGRSVPYVEAMTQILNLSRSPLPMVCEGGSVMYFPESDSYKRTSTQEVPADILTGLDEKLYYLEPGKIGCISLYPTKLSSVPELFCQVVSLGLHERFGISSSAAAVDIVPQGIDKAYGVQNALGVVGKRPRIVCIGDACNDLPMLMAADLAAAPANAVAEVKNVVNYVSSFDSTAGVLDILRKIASGTL